MNFFEHQQQARRRTSLLALLFLAAALATVALANLVVVVAVLSFTAGPPPGASVTQWLLANPKPVVWTSLAVLGFISAASLYRMASLSAGGKAVALALGGARVDHDTNDPQKRQLLNLVEEMAIAAGVPVPQLYVLEAEAGINAFAAGFTPADAAIAVTRGTIESLTRDELQGVVAHEFSHILHGDMRLNTRLLGVLYGILAIGVTGRVILRGLSHVRGSTRRGGGQAVGVAFLAGLALTAVGYLGLLFGAMIRAAVSRQREYLADAAAVQFTRNPHGIAGALKKIAVAPLRAVLQAPAADEVSHMLIADGRKMFQHFFATHPPLLDRIRRIDRRFDVSELDRIKLAPVAAAEARVPTGAEAAPAKWLSPALVVAAIGSPDAAALHAAERQHAALPEPLRRAAHSRALAPALVLALALHQDAAERGRQLARLRARLPEALVKHLDAVATMAQQLSPVQRLPLAELAFPALRERAPEELQAVIAAVEEVLRMDGRFDVLDYAIARLLRLQLIEAATPRARPMRAQKLHAVRDDAAVLFALLAQAGDRDKYVARRAYEVGMRALYGTNAPVYALPEPWVAPFDRALSRLDALAPFAKQALIEAMVATILHDRRVSLGEIELLRVICASLHCPVPALDEAPASAQPAGAPHAAA